MLTYRVGAAGSAAGSKAMAEYLSTTETLRPEAPEVARYYAGEMPPLPGSPAEELGQHLNRGETSFSEALDELISAELAMRRGETDIDYDELEERLSRELTEAATRDDFAQEVAAAGGTVSELRPDLDPAFAERLGIDSRRPLSVTEIANLLDGRRADGEAIPGKATRRPTRSVADVFGLDPSNPPAPEALAHVLAGRRADGEAPVTASGKPLSAEVVEGARKRFLAALGVTGPTGEELARLMAGRTATGGAYDLKDYRRQIHATRAPVGYVDMTFSADKSLSVAWALAPTEAERAALLDIHRGAVADAMRYVEERLGFARIGDGGKGGTEPGRLAWVSFNHYTARPAAEIARTDAEGTTYTETVQVPTQQADPQLHTHVTVLNAVLTESGRIGSLDLDLLDGAVKEFGAVYQAYVAARARLFGIDVVLDEATGAARFAAVPARVRDLFSKRSQEAQAAARALAADKGVDWDSLGPEQKIGFLKAGANESRHRKEEGASDFALWRQQAADAGYQHRSVLRPGDIRPELEAPERRAKAYDVSQTLVERMFSSRAKVDGQELREVAARGLIEAGIGERAGEDIDAVTRAYREIGVRQDGGMTALAWGRDVSLRGKERWSVTTALHEAQERELIDLARSAAADRSAALPAREIERAAAAFLASHPKVDRNGLQWRRQAELMRELGTGGRLSVAIGAAGAGKSTILAPLVDAWEADGRRVYGATLAWRQAGDLAEAGIAAERRAALAAFLGRVAAGRYKLDERSVVVVDEIGLVGTRQLLDLLRLQREHHFQIVAVGDDRQCPSPDAGPVIDLLRKALGPEAVPEILTTIRQRTEREREIAGLFREGRVQEALERKRQDGTAELVAGGRAATIERVSRLWMERATENAADPDYRLTVSAPTNADAHEIGAAIRERLREAGRLGEDRISVRAVDRTGSSYELALAVGDRVRLFDRVHDAAAGGRDRVLASNGSVVEVLALDERGMRVRNDEGAQGFVPWRKLKTRAGDPVRLSYGYALTVDTAQGSTATEHIFAMPDGSRSATLFKAYTAASRHERTNFIIVDESAERRHIFSRRMIGERHQPVREADIWRNVAENLGRKPLKASALETLGRVTHVRRGTVATFQRSMEHVERRKREPTLRTAFERGRQSIGRAAELVRSYAHELREEAGRARRRGPSLPPL